MREHIENERRVVEGRSWVNLKKLRNSGFPEGKIIAMGYIPESEYMRKRREQDEAVSRAMKGQGAPAAELDFAQETNKKLIKNDINNALKTGAEVVDEVNNMRTSILR